MTFNKQYDYRAAMPQFTDEGIDKNQKLLEMLHQMAEDKGATEAQISRAWMMCKKPWIVPIPGTRKTERLVENAGAAEVRLTKEEIVKLDTALDNMEMSDVFGGLKNQKITGGIQNGLQGFKQWNKNADTRLWCLSDRPG